MPCLIISAIAFIYFHLSTIICASFCNIKTCFFLNLRVINCLHIFQLCSTFSIWGKLPYLILATGAVKNIYGSSISCRSFTYVKTVFAVIDSDCIIAILRPNLCFICAIALPADCRIVVRAFLCFIVKTKETCADILEVNFGHE